MAGYNILAGPLQPSSQVSSAHLLTHSNVWLGTIFKLVTIQPFSHDSSAHLLTAMFGWVQYFSWSPYSILVMTAQLICSKQCMAGYNILVGHHTAIQSDRSALLLTAMYGCVQYFSWSPYSHPVLNSSAICSQQYVSG